MLRTGLIDGQTSSTCMFSREAIGSLSFTSFAVYSIYYSNLARLDDLVSDPANHVLERQWKRSSTGSQHIESTAHDLQQCVT